jgi:hypothetical protein
MSAASFVRHSILTLTLCAVAAVASAQQAAPAPEQPADYQPSVGQAGKDVVWVPTPQALVDKMLDMAQVTPSDFLMDLGSGDGRTVITAAKRGVRAMGIEYNPDMVALSRRNAEREGVSGRATFAEQDLFKSDFSKATVITMFLLEEINMKLRPTILGLKPGTRIVSNSFTMGDWRPDETATLDSAGGCESNWCTAHLWIVPAHVAGTHKTRDGEVSLTQKFQMLEGTLSSKGKSYRVEGKVAGDQIMLTAGGRELRGKVSGRRVTFE